jgi:hypothetical protein
MEVRVFGLASRIAEQLYLHVKHVVQITNLPAYATANTVSQTGQLTTARQRVIHQILGPHLFFSIVHNLREQLPCHARFTQAALRAKVIGARTANKQSRIAGIRRYRRVAGLENQIYTGPVSITGSTRESEHQEGHSIESPRRNAAGTEWHGNCKLFIASRYFDVFGTPARLSRQSIRGGSSDSAFPDPQHAIATAT